MTIGSLFSGIGGIELGLEQLGVGPTIWQCEADTWCRSILQRYWPGCTVYTDVRQVDHATPTPDILCGGFPCQDVSWAGTNHTPLGVQGRKSGLWSEFARVINALRPKTVFIENVEALRYAGRGLGTVLQDLSSLGYDAEWGCFGACETGLPHLRSRMFILAYPNTDRESVVRLHEETRQLCAPTGRDWRQQWDDVRSVGNHHGLPRRMDRKRLAALGNACVPQQAALAFQALLGRAVG